MNVVCGLNGDDLFFFMFVWVFDDEVARENMLGKLP